MHIIIIGSGPAAAFCASQIDSEKITVIEQSFESGRLRNFSDNIVTNLKSRNNIRLAEQVGGASNYWGGGYLRYDEIDLDNSNRPKYRKWPIKMKELDYFYSEAQKLCGVSFPKTEQPFKKLRMQTTIVQKNPFCVNNLFAKPNIKIKKNLQVVNVSVDLKTKCFKSVHCIRNETGEILEIKGDLCILAAGTINNVRLLSKMADHKAIDKIDNLGRNLGTHPKANIGSINIRHLVKKLNLIENRDDDSVWKHLSLREDILIECQLPNHSIRFEPIISSSLNDYKIKFAQFLLDYNLINGSSITYKYLRMLTERLINLFVKLNLYERYRVRFYLRPISNNWNSFTD